MPYRRLSPLVVRCTDVVGWTTGGEGQSSGKTSTAGVVKGSVWWTFGSPRSPEINKPVG